MSGPVGLPIGVQSEHTPLACVVTHPPGREFDLMVPANLRPHLVALDASLVDNPDYLLFDDLVLLRGMQAEHQQLVSVLQAVTGPIGHITFRELLVGALADPKVRAEVVEGSLGIERSIYSRSDADLEHARRVMGRLDVTSLTDALITGYSRYDATPLLKWPVPNLVFARDLAAIVNQCIVLTRAATSARARDMLLARAVFTHHPLFAAHDRIDLGDDPAITLEGGDIQVLNERLVLVGISERTTRAAVERLAPELFARGVDVVLACLLPKGRSMMHLDTVFTRIDRGRCLLHPPIIEAPEALGIEIGRLDRRGQRGVGRNLLTALAAEGLELEPIWCGGQDPIAQTREQWSDGANAFALAPGVVIGYARNERTLGELSRVGYRIETPDGFIANAGLYTGGQGGPVAVALGGHELVRGRGGPRCLTLPILRKVTG
jgi:arginine deiminase